jgi:hypothetical protein
MRLFACQACAQPLQFEDAQCPRCRRTLGFLSGPGGVLSAMEPEGDGAWRPLAQPRARVRLCANARHRVCNWVVPEADTHPYCSACRHNRTVPDPGISDNLANWCRIEVAKHRLMYTLHRLRLPTPTRAEDLARGLAFDFLADLPDAETRVMTGHDNGLITIALREGDHVERERMRQEMGEPYRTVLGHFRHEVGHYYWTRLVQEGGRLEAFRALFGDDRVDYGEALQRHYAEGPPPGWQGRFVSAYATAHPWEDFAETWAHYLHIVDSLETAHAFGLSVRPASPAAREALAAEVDFDPYRNADIGSLMEAWGPISFAMNSLNRSMGLRDPYPFLLAPGVVEKLGFVQRIVQERL